MRDTDDDRYTDEHNDDLDAAAGVFAAVAIGSCIYLFTFLIWSALT